MIEDYREIWLEAACGHHDKAMGRFWSEDGTNGACEECGAPQVRYIRADIAGILTSTTEQDLERIARAICRACVTELYATASARNNAVQRAWRQFIPEARAAIAAFAPGPSQ